MYLTSRETLVRGAEGDLGKHPLVERFMRVISKVLRVAASRTVVLSSLFVLVIIFEARTSWVQSHLLAALARHLTYTVALGPSDSIRYPTHGPYNDRLGYTKLPVFLERLQASGYTVEAQARNSLLAVHLMDRGLYPIYREKVQSGLQILDRNHRPIFLSTYPQRTYPDFESIPPLVVKTLLFIENREVLDTTNPYRNPSVEWDRLAGAFIDLGLNAINRHHRLSGGSTLATQIEKIRHSPGGRTPSVFEKFRQVASASLRAYQGGADTTEARRLIVRDYLNSLPLAAIAGYGEVQGLGDGLWAWYGADFKEVNRVLSLEPSDPATAREQAKAYRQVLSLLLAVNSPVRYLREHPELLEARTDAYLRLLGREGIIPSALADLARRELTPLRKSAPSFARASFITRKGTDPIRVRLLSMLGTKGMYELDRLDLNVETTLDGEIQRQVTETLMRLNDPVFADASGLKGPRLLNTGDPSSVIYSFLLFERGQGANFLRVQADNYDRPLSINEGTKLELGSTAKLRTLITYLEIVTELHGRLAKATPERLSETVQKASDPLTRWAAEYLLTAKERDLRSMLEQAMERRYSANPGERFFTGGGLHTFQNFEREDNSRILTVREAFERSVNLVFIRLMRDIVKYYMNRLPGFTPEVLENPDNPARMEYLARFADMEGREFLRRFYQKYHGLDLDGILAAVGSDQRLTPLRAAVIFRSVAPDGNLDAFKAFLKKRLPGAHLSDSAIEKLYQQYGPDRFSLADRAYLAHLHPLELWLLSFLSKHPSASLEEVTRISGPQRQEAYEWLRKPGRKNAQDRRILTILEIDAFKQIYLSWKRQGFPFGSLVPSYATAIGSSGDTPAALAELAGVILNDGVRYPTVGITRLRFAQGTPVETHLRYKPSVGERIYPPELVSVVRKAMVGVVERGTARRAYRSFVLPNGTVVELAGKTGTGDNRFEVISSRGHLIGERVRNRTATFVFMIGNRFFGAITAFVPGKVASQYGFTSSLPVQVLKDLAPSLIPLFGTGNQSPAISPLRVEHKTPGAAIAPSTQLVTAG